MKTKMTIYSVLISLIIISCKKNNEDTAISVAPNQVTDQKKEVVEAAEINIQNIYNTADDMVPTLRSLKGKVVILDFWATWCAPCIAEFPKHNILYQKYKDKGLQLIAVSNDPKDKIENFLQKADVRFPVGRIEGNQTLDAYKVQSYPTAVVINREGNIVYRGSRINEAIIQEVLEKNTFTLKAKENITEEKELTEKELIFQQAFIPGEDPVYIDFIKSTNSDNSKPNRTLVDPANISSFIIRKSPYKKSTVLGYRSDGRTGFVGLTIIGNELTNIFKVFNNISSDIRVKNVTNDTIPYDIIYARSKPENTIGKAFNEIQQELQDYLKIKLIRVNNKQRVNQLTLVSNNSDVVLKEDIIEGTSQLYTSFEQLISHFENSTQQFFDYDTSLEGKFLYTYGMDLDNIESASDPFAMLRNTLKTKGIVLESIEKQIETFEIHNVQ